MVAFRQQFNWGIFKRMIKYLFILLNSITVFILGWMGDGSVKITTAFPASVEPGKEVQAEIKITKGNLDGFGRLQLEIPEGIAIKNTTDGNEAEYTMEDNKASWTWPALPATEEITVKLTITAAEGSSGERTLRGLFSYVENNEKQQTEMDNVVITIGAPQPVAQQTPKSDSVQTPLVPQSNAEPPGEIVVERSAKKSGKDYIISVKIKKGNTKGFARYSDDAHENLQAKAIKTDGSSFSIADGKIKFVWVNVPEKDLLEVSYALVGNPSHPVLLNGEYSYLEDNQSKKIELTTDTLNFNQPAEVNEPVKEVVKTDPVKEEVKPPATEKPEIASPRKNDGKVNYRVQVGAFTNQAVNVGTLQRKFKITEKIATEMQDGFSKFMVGTHEVYRQAGEHRNRMKNNNGVKSAFVVAYNFDKRITVQEALMISNQKWNK